MKPQLSNGILTILLAGLVAGLGCVGDPPHHGQLPDLEIGGVRGTEGSLLWWFTSGVTLERDTGSGWFPVAEGSGPFFDPGAPGFARYRLREGEIEGEPFEPERVDLVLVSARSGMASYQGTPRELSLTWSLPEGAPLLQMRLSESRGGITRWLDGSCIESGAATEDCWVGESVPFSDNLFDPEVPALELSSGGTEPERVIYTASWAFYADGWDQVISSSSIPYVDLGRRVVWGDLHAHSNLSNDGCELPDLDCTDRSGQPAGDFFSLARAARLDFAAMTEHAEWDQYYPDALSDTHYEIWETQKVRVREAEKKYGSEFLPLLGSEWTFISGALDKEKDHVGGHKSLVYQDTESCEAWRVAAHWPKDTYLKGLASYHGPGPNESAVDSVPELWNTLDHAASVCGPQEVIVFSHHSAMSRPQPFDWLNPENAPDERYETTVEILSEHGSSECYDRTVEGCVWELEPDAGHVEWGSVQAALSMGYRLGFTAGTDEHDGQPGSVDNGPSCTGGQRGIECQSFGGGLTGVMIPDVLDKPSLFGAIRSRNTLADSGARLLAAVALVDARGEVHLPGDLVPLDARPWLLHVDLPDDTDLYLWEILNPQGDTLHASDSTHELVEVDTEDPFYLRFRLQSDAERSWASPFFPEQVAR